MRVFENRVLRRIFGPKKDEVTREWRKLHNEELRDLYSSPSIIRIIKSRMRWACHVGRMGNKRNACRLLVGKPEGKRPLGRPRCWMDLGEVGWGGVAGLVWLRIGRGGELLWILCWTFGFHEMQGDYRVAYHLVTSWVVIISI
jgi:hypothetical protein